MIGTYFDGRLGNQFFRYAFARLMRYERGEKDEFLFNFNLVNNVTDSTFEDVLKYFNVLPYKVTEHNLILSIGSFMQKLIYGVNRLFNGEKIKSLSQWKSLYNKGIIYSHEDLGNWNMQFFAPSRKNIVTIGKFEYPVCLEPIRNILLKEFTPKYPVDERNVELMQTILSTESVCVTIRRGDYLNSANKNNFYVCDSKYFAQAIKLVEEKIEKPTFIFFSDDIDWVKENFKTTAPCYYESGNDPIWEKLRLMYSCKHFIISNSTFSWWAQYLSRNENKIVVSPDRWFANPLWKAYLIDEKFLKVK